MEKISGKDVLLAFKECKNTGWSEAITDMFRKIKTDVANYGEFRLLSDGRDKKEDFLLDLCASVRAILVTLNFGELTSADISESEKKKITLSLEKILAYVNNEEYGYDLSPKMSSADCQEIFGDVSSERIFVTSTMAMVLTTLVYFRRAIKREGLFTVDEIGIELYNRIVCTIRDIISRFYKYAESNNFSGWGFTMNSETVNLSDTYIVVEAISRYQDAFDQNDARRDQDFMDLVDDGCGWSEKIVLAMYQVGLSIYDSTFDSKKKTSIYGSGAFYAEGLNYVINDYKQIASSNRSSSLFNPLYIAMITMYAYSDKELVIRKFMNSPKTVARYKEKYEKDADFNLSLDLIEKDHPIISNNFSAPEWKEYYLQAKSFEKYIENNHRDDFSNIPEYRDYLNATKDTIEQIQMLYRKFSDAQKLGIVDTDYVIYRNEDINTDAVYLSKLNKASIPTAYLRPLLLSSKVMIVNALLKYPQADMQSLYNDIINSTNKTRDKKTKNLTVRWLWNESEIDLLATVRNVESIAYDYCDYYENYESGFLAFQNVQKLLKKSIVNNLQGSEQIDFDSIQDDIEVNMKPAGKLSSIIIEATKKNLDVIQNEFLNNKYKFEKSLQEMRNSTEKEIEEKDKEIDEITLNHKKEISAIREDAKIADVMRMMIKEQISDYMTEMFGTISLLKLNDARTITPGRLEDSELATGDYTEINKVVELWKARISGLTLDEQILAISAKLKEVKAFQEMLERACTPILDCVKSETTAIKLEGDENKYNSAIRENFDKFKSEKYKFEEAWLKTLNRKTSGDNSFDISLANVFTRMEADLEIDAFATSKNAYNITENENNKGRNN